MELSPLLFGAYKLAKYVLYPVSWLFVLLGLLTLLTIPPPSPLRIRWIRMLAAACFLLLYLIASPMVAACLTGFLEARHPVFDQTSPQQFDAIVVLAGGTYVHGTLRPADELNDYSRHRIACGADLFSQGFAPKLVLSGGDASVFGSGPTESLEMKRWAHKLGVPDEAMIIEDRSRTTYENAVETKRLLGDASVLLITSASHLPRAVALFHKQGLRVTPYPCGFYVKDRPQDVWSDLTPFDLIPEVEALKRTTNAIDEYAGIVVYWMVGKL